MSKKCVDLYFRVQKKVKSFIFKMCGFMKYQNLFFFYFINSLYAKKNKFNRIYITFPRISPRGLSLVLTCIKAVP